MRTFTRKALFSAAGIIAALQPASSQTLLKDLVVGTESVSSGTAVAGSYPEYFTNIGSTMYFPGKNKVIGGSDNGCVLYKSDGTTAGTGMVKVIGTITGLNALVLGFTDFNGITVFSNKSNASNIELMRTDGTSAGTYAIYTFSASNYNNTPSGFCVSGSTLYFAADGGHGMELWKSDGTAAGTSEVIDLWQGTIPIVGGQINGVKLINGQPAMTTFNGKVFFWADNGSTSGLYVSDGTAAGTSMLQQTSSPQSPFFRIFNNSLFFNDAAGLLWKTDGTAANTATVPGIANVNSSLIFNNALYVAGSTLYKTDGTAAGTQTLFNTPCSIKGANATAFYLHDISSVPTKYYVSDGTAAGTGTVSWRIGAAASFDVINNKMYVTRSDSAVPQSYNNSFLWETDGTYAGTTRLISFNHGVHVFNSGLYYSDFDAATGVEPWVYAVGTATTNTNVATAIVNTAAEESMVTLFPNPVHDQITVRLESSANAYGSLTIANALGQEVKQVELSEQTVSIDLSGMAPGVYLYTITTSGQRQRSGKLIVN